MSVSVSLCVCVCVYLSRCLVSVSFCIAFSVFCVCLFGAGKIVRGIGGGGSIFLEHLDKLRICRHLNLKSRVRVFECQEQILDVVQPLLT